MYFFLKIVGLQLDRLKDSRECFLQSKSEWGSQYA